MATANSIWLTKPTMDKTIGISFFSTDTKLKQDVQNFVWKKVNERRHFGAFIQGNTDTWFFIEFQAFPVKSSGRPEISGDDYKFILDVIGWASTKFNLIVDNPFVKI